MMSRHVRRLVLDPFPLWQTGLGLFGWLLLGAMTALWAWHGKVAGLTMIFAPAAMAMSFTQKVRTWQTLPVSRSELGQAQWWYLWGRSFVLIVLVTAAAVALDLALGALRAGWADIGAYLCGEITLLFLAGLMVPVTGLVRPLMGTGGVTLAVAAVALAALGLAFHWSLDGPVSAFRAQMVWGGGLSVGLAIIAMGLSRWIPLAQPLKWSGGRATKADAAPVEQTRGTPASALRLTAFILGRLLRILPFFAVLIGILTVVARQGALKAILPPDMWLPYLPFFGGVSAMALTATVSQRMLAGLPLTAVQRTVALQAVAPILQVPLLALTIAAGAALRPDGVSAQWLMGLGVISLGAILMSAIALPMFLRFGQKAPFLFVGAVAAPAGAVTGLSAAVTLHAHRLFGIDLDRVMLILGAVLAVMVLAGWLWTGLELAYGRAAYRQRLTAFTTWRGS